MAKIIHKEIDSAVIADSFPLLKVVLIGLGSGAVFWIIAFLLNKFLLAPAYCSAENISTCQSSIGIAGNISSIVVIVMSIFVMIKLRMLQPLIVAVATAATLWGITEWTSGLGLVEEVILVLASYLIAFVLFSWLVRYEKVWPVVVALLIIVMVARIIINI